VRWPAFTLVPHWNQRGQADNGSFEDGASDKCMNDGIDNFRCVRVQWPFGWTAYQQRAYVRITWHGTLVEQKRDGSGMLFRRNRYVDPATARFTQEDPIGLGGGLNLYGFAAADPVNRSDPFGLWPLPCCIEISAGVQSAAWPWLRARQAVKQMMLFMALGMAVNAAAATPALPPPTGAGGEGWATVSEAMSPRAAAYQARISGRAGQVYLKNGVKFDGIQSGTLIDAKGPGYARFVRDGQFRSWWGGADDLVAQAQRQLAAAQGTPITWHFAEEAAANATRSLFQQRGISGIHIVVSP
jgi:RHS repeat-associated protein